MYLEHAEIKSKSGHTFIFYRGGCIQSAAAALSSYAGHAGNVRVENLLSQSIYSKKFVNIESKWDIGELSVAAF